MSLAVNDGVRLYYEAHGEGTPLLLIAGTGLNGEAWRMFQVPGLSRAHRVIVFDHRGTGRSDRPDGDYATRQFAADAIAVLDAAGAREPAHVLGHSMGGRVAQWLAIDHPERVRTLVLAASGAGQMSPDQPAIRGIALREAEGLIRHGYPAYLEHHLRSPFWFVRPDPDIVQRMYATMSGEFETELHAYLLHVLARMQHQTTELLDRIAVPTLVIVGQRDDVAHGSSSHVESSRHLAQHIRGAQYVEVADAAHGLFWERPETVNRIVLDFLAATGQRAGQGTGAGG